MEAKQKTHEEQDSNYYCDLSAINDEERKRYKEFEKVLFHQFRSIDPISNGYAIAFPLSAENIMLVAEFVSLEGQCCPFLDYSIKVDFSQELGSLEITGPEDAQTFIQAELGLL